MTTATIEDKDTKKNDRHNGFTLLDEAVWKLSFIEDVSMNGGVDSDRGEGLTEAGGVGLSLIISAIIADIKKASDIL